MQVLVTGATGFIGSHVARSLLARGHRVRALVRSREKGLRVLAPLGIPEAELAVGDMTDRGRVAEALTGCEAVLHAAASVSVTRGGIDFAVNVRGTETVVGLACERDLPVVHLSSLLSIWHPKRGVDRDAPLVSGRTRYGRSKTEADAWVRGLQERGAPVALLYPPGVIGPDDPGMSEAVRAHRSFLRGTLRCEGGDLMLDVRDLALLIARMLEERTAGRVVAAGHFLGWDELTRALEAVTGARIPRIAAPGWLLRPAARGMDLLGALTGRTMPMTGEGIEIATRFRAIESSPEVAELGVAWRDPRDTLRDLFAWLLSEGKLPARAVPALAP